ncbi:hypothetical protein DFH06DRAFT_1146245 [Mycena polygramma]|nr:hypothetical protein DFH06DRAFT_1146245 [Mycena polygramma]
MDWKAGFSHFVSAVLTSKSYLGKTRPSGGWQNEDVYRPSGGWSASPSRAPQQVQSGDGARSIRVGAIQAKVERGCFQTRTKTEIYRPFGSRESNPALPPYESDEAISQEKRNRGARRQTIIIGEDSRNKWRKARKTSTGVMYNSDSGIAASVVGRMLPFCHPAWQNGWQNGSIGYKQKVQKGSENLLEDEPSVAAAPDPVTEGEIVTLSVLTVEKWP